MDMSGVTREEAVLYLLSLQDQIDLIVQYRNSIKPYCSFVYIMVLILNGHSEYVTHA